LASDRTDENVAWQQRHRDDLAAVLSDDGADFERAIGDKVFAFDGGTGSALGGEIGDGHEPGQAVELIGEAVAGSGWMHDGILSHTERRPN
jgi:hypothetical protein